ncbi:hypothetical protein SEA_ALISHAPH_78 [Mycobacterium phage AlishaPH]|uniref:3'-phosphate/5'-hydroxy nucleic acid ligase n=1 Tax=Mycobacterium phage AlishaPH TaxID=2163590 RepID=A0A2S1PAW2_9CAUD|nr:hypothetical protein I5G91_gp16 [Mycobacterium phage AlishaPH]AWH13691.1 hypothetical protein SEA_ALISHAPH_78 [Mycobacterium phage AlishaPH]
MSAALTPRESAQRYFRGWLAAGVVTSILGNAAHAVLDPDAGSVVIAVAVAVLLPLGILGSTHGVHKLVAAGIVGRAYTAALSISVTVVAAAFLLSFFALAELVVETINAHHNYTQKERHGDRDVWLTRKGAIDANEGVRGLIPGSMGTCSYVVTGKGNPEALCSAPHGAGRRFSRTKARKLFTVDDLEARMAGIEYRKGEAWVDEIPDAYKPIDVVMHDAETLVSVDAELRQLLNVKGQ